MILVVDDDPSFRRVLEYQLKDAGYRVVSAEDGKKALDAFSQNRISAVLTDLDMPELPGIDLLKAIKQQSADIPVIVITAFGTIDSAVDAMRAGAYHYLTKPVNRDVLLHTLEQALKFSGLVTENRNLREAVSSQFKFEGITGSSKATIFVDPEQVKQVLINILINAIQAQTGGGRTRRIEDRSGPRE
jgi:DNA-binding NtrC family response regulator